MKKNSILDRLELGQETKLLIIHNDDLGLSPVENAASMKAFETGSVNSGSVMVNCPAFEEISRYIHTNPHLDIGIHLTLTSEWPAYKWGPVLPPAEVPSLVDENGFFKGGDFSDKAILSEVMAELRAQIHKALLFGIRPTHLDCHMFCLYARHEFFEAYLQLGRAYKLPILVSKDMAQFFNLRLDDFINDSDLVTDRIFLATPESYAQGLPEIYEHTLKHLSPGLNVLLIHTAYDNEEMQRITGNFPDWGAHWRQQDFDFFTSDACSNILRENNIQLITWREIDKKLRKNQLEKLDGNFSRGYLHSIIL